jgi:hypothetical protein
MLTCRVSKDFCQRGAKTSELSGNEHDNERLPHLSFYEVMRVCLPSYLSRSSFMLLSWLWLYTGVLLLLESCRRPQIALPGLYRRTWQQVYSLSRHRYAGSARISILLTGNTSPASHLLARVQRILDAVIHQILAYARGVEQYSRRRNPMWVAITPSF